MCVIALVIIVPVSVPLLSIRLCLDLVATSVEAARIASAARRVHQLAVEKLHFSTLCMHPVTCVVTQAARIYSSTPCCTINNSSWCRSVLPSYFAPRQTVSSDALHNNALHRKGLGKKTTTCAHLIPPALWYSSRGCTMTHKKVSRMSSLQLHGGRA